MSIVGSLLIAVISAYLAATLTHARYKKDRQWEVRATAYNKIVRCIFIAKKYTETYLAIHHGGETSQEESIAQLEDRKKALGELKNTLFEHYFFLTEATRQEVLNVLESADENDEQLSGSELAENDLRVLETSLENVTQQAQLDLSIYPTLVKLKLKLTKWLHTYKA